MKQIKNLLIILIVVGAVAVFFWWDAQVAIATTENLPATGEGSTHTGLTCQDINGDGLTHPCYFAVPLNPGVNYSAYYSKVIIQTVRVNDNYKEIYATLCFSRYSTWSSDPNGACFYEDHILVTPGNQYTLEHRLTDYYDGLNIWVNQDFNYALWRFRVKNIKTVNEISVEGWRGHVDGFDALDVSGGSVSTVYVGDPIDLSWSTTYASSAVLRWGGAVSVGEGSGSVNTNGSQSFTAGPSPGTATFELEITGPGQASETEPPPSKVIVTKEVTVLSRVANVGTIQVNASSRNGSFYSPINGSWSISGPNNYSSSGVGTQTISNVPPGVNYTLTANALSGYQTPVISPSATQNVVVNQTTIYNIVWDLNPPPPSQGTITVNSNVSTSWTINPGNITGFGVTGSYNLNPGTYTIAANSVSGYSGPVYSPGTTLTIASGEVKTFALSYTNVSQSMNPQIKCNGGGNCTVPYNQSTTISWSCTAPAVDNRTYIIKEPDIQDVKGMGNPGTYIYNAVSNETFTVYCVDQSWVKQTASVTVTLAGAPTLNPLGPTSCTDTAYTMDISWSGLASASFGYWVDISEDPSFASYWNKNVPSGTTTTAPSGFNVAQGSLSTLQLLPGQTYYVRIYNGLHSNVQSLNRATCSAPAGTLAVTINDQSATWTITGTASFSGTGNWSNAAATPGSYCIAAADISNKIKAYIPSSGCGTLADGNSLNFTVSYSEFTPISQTINIVYTMASLNSATVTSVDNSVCAKLTVNWMYQDNGVGEYFTVHRRAASEGSFTQIWQSPDKTYRSYQDTPPIRDTSYYYLVQTHTTLGGARSVSSNVYGPTLNRDCVANLVNSSLRISAVNGVAVASDTVPKIKKDDVLTFTLTIFNTGSASAQINYICNYATNNLVINTTSLTATGLGVVKGGIVLNSVNCDNSGAKLEISGVKQTSPTPDPNNWVITFKMTYNAQDNDSYEICGDDTYINYTDGASHNQKASFGPSLCKTGKINVPTFREVAP